VTILADAAERAEEIDVARAEEARRRAEQQLERRDSEADLVRAAAELQKALLRLRVAERSRRRRGARPSSPPGA
jgi:F-type H+-transporting ATPase subunit epsilon